MVSIALYRGGMEKQTHLKLWLLRNDRSATWLGKQIGLGPTQAADIVAGRKKPKLAQIIAIETISAGGVGREGWVQDE